MFIDREVIIFHKPISVKRYILSIPVAASFMATFASLVYGSGRAVQIILEIIRGGINAEGARIVQVALIEVIDLFLIGLVFYMISLGVYELFIEDCFKLPTWLIIRSLNDLRARLINGIILVMGIFFLGALLKWDGSTDLLRINASISLVIVTLTIFQLIQARHPAD